MTKMLGNATRYHRQGGFWWYCCVGHDGKWKHYIRRNKKAQRAREKKNWKREHDELERKYGPSP